MIDGGFEDTYKAAQPSSEYSQVVFSQPGMVELQTKPNSAVTIGTKAYVRNQLSLISPGTEAAQLHVRTGAHKPISFPISPRAYCIGIVEDSANPEDKPTRVVYRDHHASRNLDPLDLNRCVAVPASLSDTETLLCTQAIPGAYALARAGHQNGNNIAVIGLGAVGHLLVRLLIPQRPNMICGIDPHPLRRTSLDDIKFVATTENSSKLKKNRFDCVFVVCSDPSALTQALRVVAPGGTVIQLAAPHSAILIDIANMVFRKNVHLQGAHDVGIDLGLTGYSNRIHLLTDLLNLVAAGELDLSRIASTTFPPFNPAQAYNELISSKDALHSAFFDWTAGTLT